MPRGEAVMTAIVTGITYMDGFQFIGTAISESGVLHVIWPESISGQRVALFDMIEMTGEMIVSPHHGGRPAFAIYSRKFLQKATVGSLRRCLRKKSKSNQEAVWTLTS